jgi:hypothetical protein
MFPKHTPSKFLAIALTGIFLTNIYVTNIAFAERTLSDVVQAGQSRTDDAAATQTQVNELVKSTDGLKNDFIEIRKVVNELTTYNDLLSTQILQQDLDIAHLKESIKNVSVLERQLVPLMLRMIETLSIFIENDLPFLLEERLARVKTLDEIMRRSDVTIAEKYRRVIEAYEIETDYGRTIQTYVGELIIDGEMREVNFLKLGRIALFAQSTNMEISLLWNFSKRDWSKIDKRADKNELRKGIRIALKEIPPSLITIPIKTALGSKGE